MPSLYLKKVVAADRCCFSATRPACEDASQQKLQEQVKLPRWAEAAATAYRSVLSTDQIVCCGRRAYFSRPRRRSLEGEIKAAESSALARPVVSQSCPSMHCTSRVQGLDSLEHRAAGQNLETVRYPDETPAEETVSTERTAC